MIESGDLEILGLEGTVEETILEAIRSIRSIEPPNHPSDKHIGVVPPPSTQNIPPISDGFEEGGRHACCLGLRWEKAGDEYPVPGISHTSQLTVPSQTSSATLPSPVAAP